MRCNWFWKVPKCFLAVFFFLSENNFINTFAFFFMVNPLYFLNCKALSCHDDFGAEFHAPQFIYWSANSQYLRKLSIFQIVFLKIFFYVDHFLSLCWICYNTASVVYVLVFLFFILFGCKACRILAPWPGIKLAPPALEVKVLTTGSQGSP